MVNGYDSNCPTRVEVRYHMVSGELPSLFGSLLALTCNDAKSRVGSNPARDVFFSFYILCYELLRAFDGIVLSDIWIRVQLG